MEEKIVNTALDNLRKYTGIEGNFTLTRENRLDGKVDFQLPKGKEVFVAEVKREVRNYQLPIIENTARQYKNFLLIAETIFPNIKEELRKQEIAYLDAAGNIFLKTAGHYLWIEGHKVEKANIEKANRAFTATGLKVVYLFLTDEHYLNLPQRIIAEEAGVALGNINYIIRGLKEQKFLIQKGKKELQILHKKELLEKWIMSFEEKLKPALHTGNFRFTKTGDEKDWNQMTLKPHETYWGGEPAGALLTNYLQPEVFTIYTSETRNDLIKNYRIVPDAKGNIQVYSKFWKEHDTKNKTIVNPILIYTDLLNTGNSRCIETAQMIYDKHIKQNI